jgi:hypothetical protein
MSTSPSRELNAQLANLEVAAAPSPVADDVLDRQRRLRERQAAQVYITQER